MPETIFTSCFGKCVQNIYQIVETSFTPQICLPSQFTGRLSTQRTSTTLPANVAAALHRGHSGFERGCVVGLLLKHVLAAGKRRN